MRARNISDFARDIKLLIRELSGHKDETEHYNIYVRLHAQQELEQLKYFLNKFERNYDYPTADSLMPFVRYLAQRWDRIIDTDAIYTHAPRTIINKACLYMAEAMSPYFEQSKFELLMPTLNLTAQDRVRYEQGQPYHFVLTDDNDYLVDVYSSILNTVSSGKKEVYLQVSRVNSRELTRPEKQRVVNHSSHAQEVYAGMINKHPDFAERKEQFAKKMVRGDVKVTSTYNETGIKPLADRIVNQIESEADLLNLMLNKMLPKDWPDFMKTIALDKLKKVFLKNQELSQFLRGHWSQTKIREDKIREAKVRLYCLAEVYIRLRKKAGKYKSSLAWLPGLNVHKKADKIVAAGLFQQFLQTKMKLTGLRMFLKNRKKLQHLSALSQGELGIIAAKTLPVVKKANRVGVFGV